MNERFLAVLNPAAGGGKCGKRAPAALDRLRAAGLDVDLVETQGPGDATKLVREAYANGRRHFIGIGGDGTGYEIVNGLFPEALSADDKPTLGFLPLGTGNSFLRDFSADDGAEFSISALTGGRSRPCDVIQLETDEGLIHYINILSFGFTADVGALTNRRFKPLGEGGYVLAVVTEVARLKSKAYPMTVDGERRDGPCTFVSINNSKFTGGKMMMAPHAATDDGHAALVEVGHMGRMTLLRTFPKIFKGTHVHHPRIRTSNVKTIEFDVKEPLDLMIDGEIVRSTPRRLQVLPGALTVRV